MYAICPKCHYARTADDRGPANECPQCGLIFSKWMKRRFSRSSPGKPAQSRVARLGYLECLKFRLMEVEPVTSPLEFWARVAVLIGAVIWGGWFISTDYEVLRGGFSDIGSSFMHNVNLVFHEAGHVLFMPFGRFMTILGGSLAQLLMPLIVGVTFLWKYHNPFGASMALWWLAQSFMDLAPYINDARRQQLILLGGYSGTHRPGSHDWNNLLGSMGLVQEAGLIAGFVDFLGSGLMILAIVWAGLLLHAQYRHLPR